MEQQLFAEMPLKGWAEFKEFAGSMSDNWAFRGQSNGLWVLNNAIERTDFIKLHRGIEAAFLAEFQRGARNYLSRDEMPNHIIEWLALMQHHGAPTRLLDLSRSPYVAAFFAYEKCHAVGGNTIAIWAINVNFLKTRSIAQLSQYYGEDLKENSNGVNEALFEKIFYRNECSLVFPVEPFRMNRRYSLQQSIFVSTGNSYEPFMKQLQFLGDDLPRAVIRIVLPAEQQKEVLRDLQRMNLNRASLFPDLDGYAASLKLRYNSMKSPEEQASLQLRAMEDQEFRFLP